MKKRIYWMDLARSFAIFMVILVHACEIISYGKILAGHSVSKFSWLIQTEWFTLGRLGVPIFLMLSGALLLEKKITAIKDFYKHSLLPIIITTEIWILINYLYCVIFYHQKFVALDLIGQLLFLKTSMPHMWYMPMIIGIYISVPFLAKARDFFTKNHLIFIVLVTYFATSFIPTLNRFLTANHFKGGPIQFLPGFYFFGGLYGMYFLLGYLINHYHVLQKMKTMFVAIIFLSINIIQLLIQYQLFATRQFKIGNYLWYDSAPIVILSISLFEIIRRIGEGDFRIIQNAYFKKLVTQISVLSFGMYFIHYLVMKTVVKCFVTWYPRNLIKITFVFITTSIISIFVSMIISKIPILSKLLIRYKYNKINT